MDDAIKKLIYWSGYVGLIVVGCALSLFRLLPVENTSIFLFGLLFLWNGVTLILKLNLYFFQQYERKVQFLCSANLIGLGIAWGGISLSSLSEQAMPIMLLTLPFLALAFLLFSYGKHK